jgi:phosphoserine phosphatase
MSFDYVVTLLAKSWNGERADSFLAQARSHGLALQVGQPIRLEGTSVWMQRAQAASHCSLNGDSLGALREEAERLHLDVFVESEELFHTPRRLFAFDMDSTLIQAEIVDELAGLAGVKGEVSAITESAMRGEIDFPTSLTRRVSLLKGVPHESIGTLQTKIALGDGLESLMAGLKAAGCKTAILSGGFTFFARYLQESLGFDYVCANELEIVDGALTGNLATTIVDGKRKASELKAMASNEKIPLEQTVAAGDGANDLPMLSEAGTGVAYHAKPIVRATAEFRLNYCGLDALLHLLERSK